MNWKDNFGQEVKLGDTIAYLQPHYRELRLGLLLSVSSNGNARVHELKPGKAPQDYSYCLHSGRPFVRVNYSSLTDQQRFGIDKLREYYKISSI